MNLSALPQRFFMRPTLEVARALLGKTLVRTISKQTLRAIIAETEAYIGERDKACHASRGKTARTAAMYTRGGHAYVYLIYGMYWCFNIVTEREGFPAAVLIRSIELDGKRISGPGRVTRALRIDKRFNGADLMGNRELRIENTPPFGSLTSKFKIRRGPRIGVDYAGAWARKPWRFWIE